MKECASEAQGCGLGQTPSQPYTRWRGLFTTCVVEEDKIQSSTGRPECKENGNKERTAFIQLAFRAGYPAHFSKFEDIPFVNCPKPLTRWILSNLDRGVFGGTCVFLPCFSFSFREVDLWTLYRHFCRCITHQGAPTDNVFLLAEHVLLAYSTVWICYMCTLCRSPWCIIELWASIFWGGKRSVI